MKEYIFSDMLRVCPEPTRRVVRLSSGGYIRGRKNLDSCRGGMNAVLEQPLSKFRDTETPWNISRKSTAYVDWDTWGTYV